MARYIGPVCKLCRREGDEALPQGRALLLREVRVHPPPVPARPARPGPHQAERVRRCVCARSRRCAASTACSSGSSAATSSEADRRKGRTGEEMLGLLERRLDNVVLPHGLRGHARRGAPARAPQPRAGQRQARQHPELRRRAGDKIEIREASRKIPRSSAPRSPAPTSARCVSWLEVDRANFTGTVKGAAGPRGAQRADDPRAVRRRVLLALMRHVVRCSLDQHCGQAADATAAECGSSREPRRSREPRTRRREHAHDSTPMISPQLARPDPSEGHHRSRPRARTDFYGKFACEPLERGFGITVGNSLRRVLLSSLQGAAITAVRIDGALHEFTTVPDVVEDVTDIILNLKEVVFKAASAEDVHRAHRQGGPRPRATRGDIQLVDGLTVLNPDHLIADARQEGPARRWSSRSTWAAATCPPSATRRRRCRSAPSRSTRSSRPIRKVNYTVQNARVGQVTDYDKLTLEVWTNGSVTPADAVAFAAKILKEQLSIWINFEETEETRVPGGRRRRRAAQREPLPLGRRARALGALGELPAERQHHAHRRARAAHRAGHAQDQELRPQVAEGDQGDPRATWGSRSA